MELRGMRTLAALANRTFHRHFSAGSGLSEQQSPLSCKLFGTSRIQDGSGNGSGSWKYFDDLCRATTQHRHDGLLVQFSKNCEGVSSSSTGIVKPNRCQALSSSQSLSAFAHDLIFSKGSYASGAAWQFIDEGVVGPKSGNDFLTSYLNWRRCEQSRLLYQSDSSTRVQVGFIDGKGGGPSSLTASGGVCETSSRLSVPSVTWDNGLRNITPLEVSSVKKKRKKKINKHKHRKLRKRDRHRN